MQKLTLEWTKFPFVGAQDFSSQTPTRLEFDWIWIAVLLGSCLKHPLFKCVNITILLFFSLLLKLHLSCHPSFVDLSCGPSVKVYGA